MKRFKIGDIVARNSYNKDVLFKITRIIRMTNNKEIMILKGITKRIEADSPMEDLELVDKRIVDEEIESEENRIAKHIEDYITSYKNYFSFNKSKFYRTTSKKETGRILHLDGDRKYSEKSMRYYRSLGLTAIVKNIPENRQAFIIQNLLDRYNPDILVITRP